MSFVKNVARRRILIWITILKIMILFVNIKMLKIYLQSQKLKELQLFVNITIINQLLLIAINVNAIFVSNAKWIILITPKVIFKMHWSQHYSKSYPKKEMTLK